MPCQTPHPHSHIHTHPRSQHRFGTSLHCSGKASQRMQAAGHPTWSPAQPVWVAQVLQRGRQDIGEGAAREGWSPGTHRDQPCSALKPWEYGISAQLWAVVLHKKKQSDEVFQPLKWLVLSDFVKPLRFSPSRGRGRTPALKQGAIIKPQALKSFCSLDAPEQGSEDT